MAFDKRESLGQMCLSLQKSLCDTTEESQGSLPVLALTFAGLSFASEDLGLRIYRSLKLG